MLMLLLVILIRLVIVFLVLVIVFIVLGSWLSVVLVYADVDVVVVGGAGGIVVAAPAVCLF